MRHINDPLPSLLEKRPELPLRLVAAVERALEKDPAKRFPTMSEFMDELEACREQLTTGGERSGDADHPRPGRHRRPDGHSASGARAAPPLDVAARPHPHRAGARRDRRRALPVRRRHEQRQGPGGGPIKLRAVATYDPYGDATEHDDMIGNATDGNPTTYWETEEYARPARAEAGRRHRLRRRPVRLAEGDHRACLRDRPEGAHPDRLVADGGHPFRVADAHVDGRTTFKIVRGVPARYYMLWITQVIGRALVYEVKAR